MLVSTTVVSTRSAGIWRGALSGRPQRQNPRHPGAVTEEIAVLFGSLCWRPAPSYPPPGSVLDPGFRHYLVKDSTTPNVESTLAQRVLIFSTKIVPGFASLSLRGRSDSNL